MKRPDSRQPGNPYTPSRSVVQFCMPWTRLRFGRCAFAITGGPIATCSTFASAKRCGRACGGTQSPPPGEERRRAHPVLPVELCHRQAAGHLSLNDLTSLLSRGQPVPPQTRTLGARPSLRAKIGIFEAISRLCLWTTLLTDPVSGWIHRGAQQRSCTHALFHKRPVLLYYITAAG